MSKYTFIIEDKKDEKGDPGVEVETIRELDMPNIQDSESLLIPPGTLAERMGETVSSHIIAIFRGMVKCETITLQLGEGSKCD